MTGCWTLFGLHIRSELPLPGCPEADPDAPDIEVRMGELPSFGAPAAAPGPDQLQLEIKDVGRYRMRGGEEIVIDPAAGASEQDLRTFLLGSSIGALLHQRGMLPLHANAIVIEDRAVLYMGRSGAGKSTLAAWFQDKDFAVLADDVSAVGFDRTGKPIVSPGVPRLRLRDDALGMLGQDSYGLERSFRGEDKYDLPRRPHADLVARPLAACYLLDEPDGDETFRIDRLSGATAVGALVANTYRGGFVELLGATERHFTSCVRVGKDVPIFRVQRRMDRNRFEDMALELERHARQAVREGGFEVEM